MMNWLRERLARARGTNHNHDAHAGAHGHAIAHGVSEADLRRAYEKGRRDERSRRKSHPILSLVVFVAAVVGAGMIYLAAREGSFTRGGYVVDTRIASAAEDAQGVGEQAASRLTTAAENGQDAVQETLRR